jgi:hypothetical protein
MQRRYPVKYWRQFDLVITAHSAQKEGNVLNWQQCYPWHVGWSKSKAAPTSSPARSFLALSTEVLPAKKKKLSVICSMDSRLPGHQKRLKFLRLLKEELGDEMDWFGRGISPIDDKWEGLADYHYHLCMENSVLDNYWTEKIGDAFLAGCVPIYWGAPNISAYFDPRGFEVIDIERSAESICRIRHIIESPPSLKRIAAVLENRRRVMEDYSYYGLIRGIGARYLNNELRQRTIQPLSRFRTSRHVAVDKLVRIPSRLWYSVSCFFSGIHIK